MRRRRLFGLLAAAPLVPVVASVPAAMAQGGVLSAGTALLGDTAPEAIIPRVLRTLQFRPVIVPSPVLSVFRADEVDDDDSRRFPAEAELAATLGIGEGA